jgi:hypothetical protein
MGAKERERASMAETEIDTEREVEREIVKEK